VQDLEVESTAPRAVTLRWTAPGDSRGIGVASSYDLRYSREFLTAATWDSASVVDSLPAPRPVGARERCTISHIDAGAWYFGVKSADEVPNWSVLSNVAGAEVPHAVLFPGVADLRVTASAANSVTLSWTAPGDETTAPVAKEYDVRVSRTEITPEVWGQATLVIGVPSPAERGSHESFTVAGLEGMTTYYFALRASNEEDDWSPISNVVNEATSPYPCRRLTISPRIPGVRFCAWSPDGVSIAVSVDWDGLGQAQVYKVPMDGGDPVRLTSESLGAWSPAWSPDGTRIAYVSARNVGFETYYDLKIRSVQPGSAGTILTTHGDRQPIVKPSWSPDERRIVYALEVSFNPRIHEMHSITTDGGRRELLLGAAANGWGPDWSPDGTRIAYATYGDEGDLWSLPLGVGAPVQLSASPTAESWPDWSPDGTRIAFSSNQSGDQDIWTLHATGGEVTRVTFDSDDEYFPSWSPDGRALCFVRFSNGVGDVWIVHLDEGSQSDREPEDSGGAARH
jgi:dipeptidyl aminopeptidase/acylaminoacyl peptidase